MILIFLVSKACCVVQELHRRYKTGLPKLDPVTDMGIDSPVLASALADVRHMEIALQNNVVSQVSDFFMPLKAANSATKDSEGDI